MFFKRKNVNLANLVDKRCLEMLSDCRIDQLVYKLYDLTNEEIETIEKEK